MRLDGRLLDLMDPEGLGEDSIRPSQPGGNVSDLSLDVLHDVARGVVCTLHVGFVVDDRRVAGDGFVLVEHCRQDLIFDLDQINRGFCDLNRLCCYGSDPITNMSNLVVEADLVVGQWVRVALAP